MKALWANRRRWLAQAFAMPALATPPRSHQHYLPPSRLTAGDQLAALLSASACGRMTGNARAMRREAD